MPQRQQCDCVIKPQHNGGLTPNRKSGIGFEVEIFSRGLGLDWKSRKVWLFVTSRP